MSHLIVLGFHDSASAQAARAVMQEADPLELTILDEESFAQFAPQASKRLASMPLWVRFPLAMFVGVFAGIYYGAKWFSQTMDAVANFLGEPQTTTNGQTSYGRAILLLDAASFETFVNKFKQLGASVQQVDLSAKEAERLRSQQAAQPQAAQPQAAQTAETQP
jgi:hypothetical protein